MGVLRTIEFLAGDAKPNGFTQSDLQRSFASTQSHTTTMKRARQRPHLRLPQLHASVRPADRALTEGLDRVSDANKSMARKKPRFTPAELIAQSPGGFYIDED